MKKTTIILTALVALMVFVACEKQQQNQQHSPKNNAPQVRAEQNTQSINEFWSAFRNAVLANDKKFIAEMTQFPFVAAYSPAR
jgi:outer membrane biogenesis lipoprotein LolB